MMSKSVTLFVLMLIGTAAIAQTEAVATADSLTELSREPSNIHLFDQYTESGHRVGMFGDFSLNSTALTNSFYSPFIKGGTITNELKADVQDRMGGFNAVGFDLDYGFKYAHKIDSMGGKASNLTIFGSIADRQHADASFSTNLFNGIFSGNKQFEGDTVQLADASVNYLTYQHVKFGAAYQHNNMTFGLAAGFILGEQFLTAELNRANLYTAEFGTELALDLNLEIQQSDTSNKNFGAGNGYGFSTDLFFEYSDSEWGNFLIEITDLGLIGWSDQSLSYNTDTNYHFEGFYVPNILDLQDSVYWNGQSDSLSDAVKPAYSLGKVNTPLPTWFAITYGKVLKNPNYTMFSGVRYRLNSNYQPYFFLRCARQLGNFSVDATFGYGGYGGINFGLRVSANIKDKLLLFVNAPNLEGVIAPKLTGSKALAAGISYIF